MILTQHMLRRRPDAVRFLATRCSPCTSFFHLQFGQDMNIYPIICLFFMYHAPEVWHFISAQLNVLLEQLDRLGLRVIWLFSTLVLFDHNDILTLSGIFVERKCFSIKINIRNSVARVLRCCTGVVLNRVPNRFEHSSPKIGIQLSYFCNVDVGKFSKKLL